MSVSNCCISGFTWNGTPVGKTTKLGPNDSYVTGSDPNKAVLLVHDLFGWTFPNVRLLADHLAKEAGVTVYVPDYFGGEVVDPDIIIKDRLNEFDLSGYITRNSREIREPEIFESARTLRREYKKVGAIGYCYGGWACLRLAAKEHQPPLVDCISIGHPSLLVKGDIDEVAKLPLQILAPEIDPAYTDELKLYTFQTLQKLGVPFDYQHFPGVVHACFIRGDPNKPGEQAAMVRAKNAAVAFFREHLDIN